MGAEAARGAQGHGGMNAELASFVAGGGDDAALVGAAADNNGLAAEVGALEEFDGDEEGVHVHVEDGGDRRRFGAVGGVVFGAEASQVRHGISVRLRSGGGNEGDRFVTASPRNWNLMAGITAQKRELRFRTQRRPPQKAAATNADSRPLESGRYADGFGKCSSIRQLVEFCFAFGGSSGMMGRIY